MPPTENSESTHEGQGGDDRRERDLFMRAIEILDHGKREDFLRSACGDDSEMVRRVQQLIQQHEGESNLIIDRPLFQTASSPDLPEEIRGSGVVCGGYELIERLGEGGMGEVWLARQDKPVQRLVALKLVRTGRETAGVLQRFEAERQALAILDHPNIARVIDAGATPGGLPFFVMELVDGLPLDEYCDQAKLTIPQRLEIFTQIAQAISHAHQKAILHRDLKPSNVLVTQVDGRAIPKVIDFGLAKALSGTLTPDPLATRAGDVLGTLEYMAPEQAGFQGQDIDTRADVYSLGVLLYEMLTGLRPFDSKKLHEAALDEALRIVKEEDPAIPSLRFSSSGNAAASAQLRQTESSRLRRLLRNELDWIVMKALEKDRSRRYQSASEFADDVNRYLNGEAVEAHPPSRLYRIRKFVSKNRGLATSIAAVTLALLVGMAGTSYGLLRASVATSVALREKADAEAARTEAVAAKEEESRQKRFAVAISDFLKNDFLRLTSVISQVQSSELRQIAATDGVVGFDATMGDLVARAEEKLIRRSDLEPLVDAEISWMIGACYKSNSDDDRAIPLLERAMRGFRKELGNESENFQGARRSLCNSLLGSGKLDEAEVLITEAISQPRLPDGHSDRFIALGTRDLAALHSLRGDGVRAVEMGEKSLELCQQVEGYPGDVIISRLVLGKYLCDAANSERGIPLIKQSIDALSEAYGEDYPATLSYTLYYARALRRAGKNEEAIKSYELVLPLMKKRLGPKNDITLTAMSNLATAYSYAKSTDKAIEMARESMELTVSAFSQDDMRAAQRMAALGMIYATNRRMSEAIPLLEKATEVALKLRTAHDSNTRLYMDRLAKVYCFSGELKKSKDTFEQLLNSQVVAIGESHPDSLRTMQRLAEVCEKLSNHERAVALFDRRFKLVRAELGEDNLQTQLYESGYLAALGTKLMSEADFEAAEKSLRAAFEIRNSKLPDDWFTYQIQSKLGEAQYGSGHSDDAQRSLETAFQKMKRTAKGHPDRTYFLNNVVDRLIMLAQSANDLDALKKWQVEKEALIQKSQTTTK